MFRKLSKLFFGLLSLSLIFSSIIPTEAFAQKPEVVEEDTVPLVVKIHNTAYSNDKRLVSIDFSVQNNSQSFVDNLRYSFEFYNGEKLEDSGLLFRNLDYILSTSDSYERLSPGEMRRQTIQYELPPTIPGGNYFLRGTVYNEELSYYGITYTPEPLKLTGRGTFISTKNAALVDVENKKVYRLMEGPTLEKDKSYVVAFPKSSNQQLYEAMEKENIYADIKISHISDNEKIVYEKSDILLDDLIREDGKGLEFKINPWENIMSGSHTAFISFKNARGEQIAESTLVRLLYRGLLGRIYQVDTDINSYRKGEPINLIVNTTIAGDPLAKKSFLKAVFKNKGEVIQQVEKEIELNGDFQGTDTDVDFADEKIKSKTLIDEIELTLTDENGNVLDTQIVTMDTSKIFAYPKSNLFRNILWSLLGLIVIVGGLAFLKKKTNFTLVSIAIAFILVGGSVVYAQDFGEQVWGCTNPSADNYNEFATDDDGTCTYVDNIPGEDAEISGCTDSAADNYNSSATVNDGTCTYNSGFDYTIYGCLDPSATNYNSGATESDNSCVYSSQSETPSSCEEGLTLVGSECKRVGCMDGSANNYDEDAEVDIMSNPSLVSPEDYEARACTYGQPQTETPNYQGLPQLSGDLLEIWSVPDGEPVGDQGVCRNGNCSDIEFYVKVQCKECGNQGLGVTVRFYNDTSDVVTSSDADGISVSNTVVTKEWNVNIAPMDGEDDPFLFDYNYYLVADDDLLNKQSENIAYSTELKKAKENYLAGIPVAANDVINEWIFGPFREEFCFQENISTANAQGMFSQTYALEAVTLFGGDFCQLSFEEGDARRGLEFAGVTTESREMLCKLTGEIQASFYLDDNQNGLKEDAELFIKSPFAPESCIGEEGSATGAVQEENSYVPYWRNLVPQNCGVDNVPYFVRDLLTPGNYKTLLDTTNSFGWAQTGVEYMYQTLGYINADSNDTPSDWGLSQYSEWLTTYQQPYTYGGMFGDLYQGFIEKDVFPVVSSGILKARIGLRSTNPVNISCRANPSESAEFPLRVLWSIDGFYSDQYEIEDLYFVWNGVGTLPDNEEVAGTSMDGVYEITYNEETGGPRNYAVNVYAKNGAGETVSNTASCVVDITPFQASCAAYPSLAAEVPQAFFDVGEDVYWKSSVENGNDPYDYVWSGAGLAGNENQSAGPVQYGVKGQIQTANLTVTDFDNLETEASCSIFVRECRADTDCANGYFCNQSTFTCQLPPPVFSQVLQLNPSVINTGEQCRLRWTVDSADSCILYKNNQAINSNAATSTQGTDGVDVGTGTYTIICENENGLSVTGGPVRCLVNPNIREQ